MGTPIFIAAFWADQLNKKGLRVGRPSPDEYIDFLFSARGSLEGRVAAANAKALDEMEKDVQAVCASASSGPGSSGPVSTGTARPLK